MFTFLLKLCGYAYHPPFVCHALEECPACRALVERRQLRRLCHKLAIECLSHHERFESLVRTALCIREPDDEERAADKAAALAQDAPF